MLLLIVAINLFLIPRTVFASENLVVINEFVTARDQEWVELYNLSDKSASLDGCTLRMHDNPNSSQKISFGSEDSFEKFFLVRQGDNNWKSNWLNASGDLIVFTCNDNEVDKIAYGNADSAIIKAPNNAKNESAGRSPDGTGEWTILAEQTLGRPNAKPPTPTPTVTPTPSNSPTPTKIPTPTKAPTPTKNPTPTKTLKTPTTTKIPTDIPSSSNAGIDKKEITKSIDQKKEPTVPNAVLGSKANNSSSRSANAIIRKDRSEDKEATNSADQVDSNNKIRIIFLTFGGLCMAGMATSAFIIQRRQSS